MRLKCILYSASRSKEKKRRASTHANSSDRKQNCIYCVCYYIFFPVCMYGFNFCFFFEQWKYWKMSLFRFQNADLLLLYLTHSCYSLLNMFVTVAVINVKLLAVWGFVAFLHVSILCAVSYTLYGHEYEWDWDQVNYTTTFVCVRVRMWGLCVCVCACYCLS